VKVWMLASKLMPSRRSTWTSSRALASACPVLPCVTARTSAYVVITIVTTIASRANARTNPADAIPRRTAHTPGSSNQARRPVISDGRAAPVR
jgi:hypothetical protein